MTYEEKLEEVLALKCLAHSKKMSDADSQVFAIRGTSIFVKILKEYVSPYDPETISGYRMSWMSKNKKYNYSRTGSGYYNNYVNITFEEVLDSKVISDKARQELLFNLDVFTGKK